MAARTVLMAVALAIGVPCTAVQLNGFSDWPTVWIMAGIGFAIGIVIMVTIDEVFYRKDQSSFIRQRDATTDATQVNTLERKAKLLPKLESVESESETIGEEITRLQRTRQFEIAHWRVYFRRIWGAGQAYGWDIRTLTDKKRETRVTTQPGWNVATDALVAAGVLAKDGTTRALVSDAQWESERMWEKVPPPQGEPPEILPPPYTTQQTRQNTTAKQAVIDG